mmetsp:Transcript_8329/g.21240  ORF Transcript_8329/g.21240 Transcript_8329/m.21240 type:complete len:231 (+) Transcript_8329:392-1084(+)
MSSGSWAVSGTVTGNPVSKRLSICGTKWAEIGGAIMVLYADRIVATATGSFVTVGVAAIVAEPRETPVLMLKNSITSPADASLRLLPVSTKRAAGPPCGPADGPSGTLMAQQTFAKSSPVKEISDCSTSGPRRLVVEWNPSALVASSRGGSPNAADGALSRTIRSPPYMCPPPPFDSTTPIDGPPRIVKFDTVHAVELISRSECCPPRGKTVIGVPLVTMPPSDKRFPVM